VTGKRETRGSAALHTPVHPVRFVELCQRMEMGPASESGSGKAGVS
jgi:hypothetical protein